MEVCAGFELIAMENATALGDDVLEISKRREAQMIGHMRHGSPPRLIALQSILSPNRRESLPTLSAGVRMTGIGIPLRKDIRLVSVSYLFSLPAGCGGDRSRCWKQRTHA